jgi:hypothetical protein
MIHPSSEDQAARVGMLRRRPSAILLALAIVALGSVPAEYLVSVSARVWVANGGWVISSLVALVGVRAAMRASAPRDRAGWTRVYRYGGEELLLVLPDQDARAGGIAAERQRASIERAGIAHPRNAPSGVITFSGGVAAVQPGETPEAVLRRADQALYRAKSSGRNQIAVAADESLPRLIAGTRP